MTNAVNTDNDLIIQLDRKSSSKIQKQRPKNQKTKNMRTDYKCGFRLELLSIVRTRRTSWNRVEFCDLRFGVGDFYRHPLSKKART